MTRPGTSPFPHHAFFPVTPIRHRLSSHRHVVPHGSYLVNLAAADPERATQAFDCFLEDLQRCEALGIGLYNFQ